MHAFFFVCVAVMCIVRVTYFSETRVLFFSSSTGLPFFSHMTTT